MGNDKYAKRMEQIMTRYGTEADIIQILREQPEKKEDRELQRTGQTREDSL